MPPEYPWQTLTARRMRAAELCARCAAEHTVGNLLCYCMLDSGHKGDHVDHAGRRFTQFFSSTGAYVRDMARRAAQKKSPA